MSGEGRGTYHAIVVRLARGPLPTLLVSLSWLIACASGTDDTGGASGLSIGAVSQGAQPTQGSQGSQGGEGTTGDGSVGGDDTYSPTGALDDSGVPTSAAADPTAPTFECGDGVLDPNEECDGPELDAQSCDSFGFDGGTLLCTDNCTYDTSMCDAAAVCGDGLLDVDSEECDCGNGQCSAAQLGNQNCMALPSPKGPPYSGGNLSCTGASCTFNPAACTYCGDGIRNGSEVCEASDLGGQTCVSQGFDGGNLSCTGDCGFNTAGCSKSVCGDGQCQAPVEDDCSCPQDCPDNPNECSQCECGGQGGPSCGCDVLCLYYGDCCFGGPC